MRVKTKIKNKFSIRVKLKRIKILIKEKKIKRIKTRIK
jgi:hypothetical protein